MAKRVLTGCRDCRKCSISGVGKAGRGIGRGTAAVVTFGMSEAAMATTKDCGACGHALSLHGDEKVEGWAQKKQGSAPAPADRVQPISDTVGLDATPEQVWSALLDGIEDKAIRKRDATSVRIKFGGGFSGTPAALLQVSITPAADGTRVQFTIDAGAMANAVTGTQAAKINEAIIERGDWLGQRLAPFQVSSLAPEEAPQPPATVADPVEQLKRLADLRDAGVLTEDEFAAKKAEILGRM